MGWFDFFTDLFGDGPPAAGREEYFEQLRNHMVADQLSARGLRDERILRAFRAVPRHEFVPRSAQAKAYRDAPLAIGDDQTISQPYMVALMTWLLRPGPGERILEVGTGSGYQAAILSRLAGRVYSIERKEGLYRRAAGTLERLGIDNVETIHGDGSAGLPANAPYDGIVVTAGSPGVPPSLPPQLAPGGRLVIPVGPANRQRLVRLTREEGQMRHEDFCECMFVKLFGAEGWEEGMEGSGSAIS